MPYQDLADGLYLIKQKSAKKGNMIEHYGILDIGNILRHPQADAKHPLVIHQTPPKLRIDWLANTGTWEVVKKIHNLKGAKKRIKQALKEPTYDLFGNNCEHFARFVVTGKKESKQLQNTVKIAGLVAITIYLWNMGGDDKKGQGSHFKS